MKKVYVEGTDLIGKTTLCEVLKEDFDVSDRLLELTKQIRKDGKLKSEEEIKNIVSGLGENEYLLILYTTKTEILEERLEKRKEAGLADEFDKECVLYNNSYVEIIKLVYTYKNVIGLCIDNMETEDIKNFLLEKLA